MNIHGEAGRADHEGGRRDHREGVYEGTRTRHSEEITLQGIYALSIPCISNLAKEECTALVVGSDDVASSYSIGVLTRRQVGRREGSRGALEVANY